MMSLNGLNRPINLKNYVIELELQVDSHFERVWLQKFSISKFYQTVIEREFFFIADFNSLNFVVARSETPRENPRFWT